jgi:predicted dinucleotide-binding enzyme
MKIGIIGAGHIGATLTRRLRAVGNDVAVANSRGPESLKDLAQETGAAAVPLGDAVPGKDLVIIAIPERNIPDLPRDLFAKSPLGLVIVDTGNYYPRQRDGRIAAIEDGMPESQWVAQQLQRPVVKAFNTIYAQHIMDLGRPSGTAGRIALPVAGDSPIAKAKVMRLIDELGFDAVDAGKLEESWRQQPGTPVYGQDFDSSGTRRALSEAQRDRTPEWRADPQTAGQHS